LDCWQRPASQLANVLDVGAGPATRPLNLAEIVGPTGEVVALERSQNFICAMESTCRALSLANVRFTRWI
jgi:precorrin-6B methylase 2